MAKDARLKLVIDALNLASDELKRLQNDLEQTGKKSQELSQKQKALADSSLKVSAAFAGIAAAGSAMLITSTKLAARVETLGVVTQTLGKNAGMTAQEIRDLEKAIQDKGITLQASRQAIAQMIQAEIDLAHATNLARLAQDAAVISGENSSAAFEQLVYVVSTGNVLMARRMGLLVDFQKAYDREAQAVGKSAAALSEQEKVNARVNEVMRQGANIAGSYEAAMDTAGKKAASLARHQEEAARALGEMWLPTYASAVDAVTSGMRAFNDLDQAQKDGVSSAIGYATAIGLANAATFASIGTFIKTKAALDALTVSLGFASKAALGLAFAKIAIPVTAIAAVGVSWYKVSEQVKAGVQDTNRSWDDFIKKQAETAQSATQAADAIIDAQANIKKALDQGGAASALIGDPKKLMGDYRQMEQVVRDLAGSYEEYADAMERLAQSGGFGISDTGDLQKGSRGRGGINWETVEKGLVVVSEAQWNAQKSTIALHEAWEKSNEELRLLTEQSLVWQQILNQMTAQDLALAVAGPLDQAVKQHIQSQDELLYKINEVRYQIKLYEELSYLSPAQKEELNGLRSSLGDLSATYHQNAADHEEATNRIIFQMAMQRLAMLELTDDQRLAALGMLNDIAREWGIFGERTYQAMQAIDKAFYDLANGQGIASAKSAILSVGDTAASISGNYPINFVVSASAADDQSAGIFGLPMHGTGGPRVNLARHLSGNFSHIPERTQYIPGQTPYQPPPGYGGGSGGGGGGRAGGGGASEPYERIKTEMEKLMEAMSGVARLGEFAADALRKDVLEPLNEQLEQINKLMSPRHIDLMARERMVELEEKRRTALEQIARTEAQINAYQKERQRFQFLEQQLKLLEMIRENELNAAEVLGGLKLGLDIGMGEVLEAMTRAMAMLVERAETELEIASPSRKFAYVGKMSALGLEKGWVDYIEHVRRSVETTTRSILPDFDTTTIGGIGRQQQVIQPAPERREPLAPVTIYATVQDKTDVEDLALRIAEIQRRRLS